MISNGTKRTEAWRSTVLDVERRHLNDTREQVGPSTLINFLAACLLVVLAVTSNARAEKRAAAFDGFAAYTFHMDDVFDTNQIFDEAGRTPALWKAVQT